MLGQDDVVNTEWRKLHAKDSVETTTKKAELQKKRAMAATRDGKKPQQSKEKRYAYRRGKKRSADGDDDSDDDGDDDGDDDEDSVEMSAAEEDDAAEEAEAVATQANEPDS